MVGQKSFYFGPPTHLSIKYSLIDFLLILLTRFLCVLYFSQLSLDLILLYLLKSIFFLECLSSWFMYEAGCCVLLRFFKGMCLFTTSKKDDSKVSYVLCISLLSFIICSSSLTLSRSCMNAS